MKRLLGILLLLCAGVASADELGDANRLLKDKAYDKAFPIYSRLAAAGNPEAQFRLGEMYWYGDGTATNLVAAKMWLQKAAATGHHDAQEDLAALKAREGRDADIAYWTTNYKGEDLTSGKFACPAPAIPKVSTTNGDIKTVSDAVATWQTCYNGFVANVNAALPPGKRIPDEVAALMTPHEMAAASAHLDQVYGGVIARAQATASTVAKERDAWQKATEQYVAAQNRSLEATRKIMMEQAEASRISSESTARTVR